MYDYAIRAAFEDAKRDNYQHPVGLDPDMVAAECSDLIDAVGETLTPFDIENVDQEKQEEQRAFVLQESFVRAFEAGLAVGLEAGREGIEVKLFVDRETITGLVQGALRGGPSLKE